MPGAQYTLAYLSYLLSQLCCVLILALQVVEAIKTVGRFKSISMLCAQYTLSHLNCMFSQQHYPLTMALQMVEGDKIVHRHECI